MERFASEAVVKALAWAPPRHLDFDGGHVLVYALVDPRDCTVRYVGVTNDRARRLEEHQRAETRNPRMRAWLRELQGSVRMVTLGLARGGLWKKAERNWIAWFFKNGWSLYNAHPGGIRTPESAARDAAKMQRLRARAAAYPAVPKEPRARGGKKRKGKARRARITAERLAREYANNFGPYVRKSR